MSQSAGIKNRYRPDMKKRRNLMGLVFVSPWLLGVVVFFFIPMKEAILYMFNDITIEANGIQKVFMGKQIIREVIFEDPDNIRMMVTALGGMLGEVILVIAFSLFLAIVLNQKFFGRSVARAVFALPIIVSSGVLMAVFKQDLFAATMNQNSEATIFQSAALEMSVLKLGIDPSIVGWLTGMVASILDLLWKCGVQILLFLGGLKSISPQLYEVCDVEGANAWQVFWKVTFPMITPFILLNTVYSIIDSFTFYSNPVMQRIQEYFNKLYTSSASTLAVVYCLFVLVITGIVAGFLSRKVFYIEK